MCSDLWQRRSDAVGTREGGMIQERIPSSESEGEETEVELVKIVWRTGTSPKRKQSLCKEDKIKSERAGAALRR